MYKITPLQADDFEGGAILLLLQLSTAFDGAAHEWFELYFNERTLTPNWIVCIYTCHIAIWAT